MILEPESCAINFLADDAVWADGYHRVAPPGREEVSRVDDALRIAIVAPAWYPLPPRGYGGTELVVHLLHTELRRLGHHVTGFGAEGSAERGTVLAGCRLRPQLGRRGRSG